MTPVCIRLWPAFAAAALCPIILGAALAAPRAIKPPLRPRPNTPSAYALGPPAALALVTNKDNGGSITLPPDTTLVVRLRTDSPAQSAWNLLLPPSLPLRLAAPPRHDRAVDEFQFFPHYLPGKTQTFFLHFVYGDPDLPAMSGGRTWRIKVVVPPRFVEPSHTPSPSTPSSSH